MRCIFSFKKLIKIRLRSVILIAIAMAVLIPSLFFLSSIRFKVSYLFYWESGYIKDFKEYKNKFELLISEIDRFVDNYPDFFKEFDGTCYVEEVLCDKPNYNDFEKGDEDTYPFIMPENVDLSSVSAITARMGGNTASGDWYCDWIEIKNSSRERLFRLDSDFWLSTGQNKEFSNFSKYYSIPSAALRIDPKIMNFLWSLGKI